MLANVVMVETDSLIEELDWYAVADGEYIRVAVYLCGVLVGLVSIKSQQEQVEALTDEVISARLNSISQGV